MQQNSQQPANFHYCSQMYPVIILPSFFKVHFNIIHPRLGLPRCLISFKCPARNSLLPLRSTCPAHLIVLGLNRILEHKTNSV